MSPTWELLGPKVNLCKWAWKIIFYVFVISLSSYFLFLFFMKNSQPLELNRLACKLYMKNIDYIRLTMCNQFDLKLKNLNNNNFFFFFLNRNNDNFRYYRHQGTPLIYYKIIYPLFDFNKKWPTIRLGS